MMRNGLYGSTHKSWKAMTNAVLKGNFERVGDVR